MKITKQQLKQIIKEEMHGLEEEIGDDRGAYGALDQNSPMEDIKDAIQMLENEEDASGTLFNVINRLQEALGKMDKSDPQPEMDMSKLSYEEKIAIMADR